MDITYIPMARGFVYLAAVVDWFSRRVLAWRLSIAHSDDCSHRFRSKPARDSDDPGRVAVRVASG